MGRHAQSGVSLIEILVALGILSMLLGVALPSFRVWIQNTQIRTAAEAIYNGVQAARNEAIRKNSVFELTIHNGTAWDICPSSDSYPCAAPIMTRAHDEGSTNATVTTTPGGSATIAFNGLGRVVGNADGSATMSQVDIDNAQLAAADKRAMRILISPGGATRLCDPAVAAGDPRACS
jgi:type IV fimbrial biogenesis protein FimT